MENAQNRQEGNPNLGTEVRIDTFGYELRSAIRFKTTPEIRQLPSLCCSIK
jgi:hypothetical protein